LGVAAAAAGSGRRYGAPHGECARTQKSLMAGPKPMSPNGEQVADDVVDCEEPLGLCRRFETPHVALASARRLVGDFGPVIGVAGYVVDDARHDHPVGGTVAPEAIGDEAAGDTAARLE